MPELALNAYIEASEIADNNNLDILIKSAESLVLTENITEAEILVKEFE